MPENTQTQLSAAEQAKKDEADAKAAAAKAKADEPRFELDRVLGPDGPAITGQPAHVIAGALHETKAKSFTRGDLETAISRYLKRPVEPTGEEA